MNARLTQVRERLQGWFRGAADKPVDVLPVRVGGT